MIARSYCDSIRSVIGEWRDSIDDDDDDDVGGGRNFIFRPSARTNHRREGRVRFPSTQPATSVASSVSCERRITWIRAIVNRRNFLIFRATRRTVYNVTQMHPIRMEQIKINDSSFPKCCSIFLRRFRQNL